MTAQSGTVPASIDVPPHPRLLSVLGDIEFQPWQCIAELIDNAFDEFLRHPERHADNEPTVWVSLPARNSSPRDAEVWIEDNGTGMTLEQLRDALRAGWTSNDRYGSLGLFGVGFNIATARLGHVAIVRTAREEDPVWQVVTIDLRKVAAGNDFVLPVTTEVKQLGEHGTKVVIRDLKPEHHETLSRRQVSIKNILGDVYSYLLDTKDFRIVVDNEAVKPRRACIWNEERFVVRNREQIHAVLPIDEVLPDRAACLNCGTWQDGSQEGACESCHSTNIAVQRRRIWGWVGIQRYISSTDFGIDFIRNGRKILLRDVSLFTWSDPNEPSSRTRMANERALGISFMWAAQAWPQLAAIFGEQEARTLVGLTNNLIVFGGSKDVAFNQEISDLLGAVRVSRVGWQTGQMGGRQVTADDIPILTAAEVRQLKERHALVLSENGAPIIARLRRCIDGEPGQRLLADQARLRDGVGADRRRAVSAEARAAAALVEARRRGLTRDHEDILS